MKQKITILSVVSVFLTGLLALVLFVSREKDLSLRWLTENSRSQLDLMGDLLQAEIEQLKTQLGKVASYMEAGHIDEAQRQLQSFAGVAAYPLDQGTPFWKVQSREFQRDIGSKDEWGLEGIQNIVSPQIKGGQLRLGALQMEDGTFRSVLVVAAKIRDAKTGLIHSVKLAGVSSKPFFQNLVERLKAQGVHAFLTTDRGITLAHTVSEYLGNSMSGDQTYEQIRSDRQNFGMVSSTDIRGDQILSFFIKLPIENLTLVSQWRQSVWMATDWVFYGQLVFLLLALTLGVGFALQTLLKQIREGERVEVPVERIIEKIVERVVEKPASSTLPSSVSALLDGKPKFNLEVGGGDLLEPAENAPSKLLSRTVKDSAKLNSEVEPLIPLRMLGQILDRLRAPLLSVLGQVQIARVHPQGGALNVIETEVRSTQSLIDRLGLYCGQSQIPSVTVPFYELVEAALRMVEGIVLRGNIKIQREVQPELAIKCDVDDLKSALAAIFRNSIESMERSLKKTLVVRAIKHHETILVEVEDSGEGILIENLDKIQEPFFSTRSPMDHQGLGLPMAIGIFRQHGFQFHINSKLGEGTMLTIKMPLSHDVVHSLSDLGLSRRKVKDLSSANTTMVPTPTMSALAASEWGESELKPSVETVPSPSNPSSMNENSPKDLDLSIEAAEIEASTGVRSPSIDLSFMESDDEAENEFQFGRLDFSDPLNPGPMAGPRQESKSKAAPNVVPSSKPMKALDETTRDDEPVTLRRLKKRDDLGAKVKVHIPRPEERI